jgi:cytochrome c553
VVGVAGVAMAQLAVELTKQGFLVSGSDKDFYEPMGSFLRNSSVTLFKGYAATNVPPSVDLVVIGNAVSYENVEVAVVEERNLPYTCFPRMLHETIIEGKRSIVVTGTHGKSTTTALIASTLLKLRGEPSYFVGGIAQDLPMRLKKEEINSTIQYVLSLSNKGNKNANDLALGETIFKANCVACHGNDGKGNQKLGAPNLTDAIWLYGESNEELYKTIYFARAGVMPFWINRLDDNTIKQLSLYVHSLGGGVK